MSIFLIVIERGLLAFSERDGLGGYRLLEVSVKEGKGQVSTAVALIEVKGRPGGTQFFLTLLQSMQKFGHDSLRIKNWRDPVYHNLVLGIFLLSWLPTYLKMLALKLHLKPFNRILGVAIARDP